MAGFPILASRRLRSTPYTERVEAAGLTGYTIYNHMFLPTSFGSLEGDYKHLKEDVQIWDVSVERQVELRGPDAHKLAIMMSARDLTNAEPGRCYYAPICDGNGGMLNDPIALCLAPDRFWFSIADSDLVLWAAGLAEGMGLDVKVFEPDVSPLAIQGPKAEDLMAKIFGEEIRSVRFFRFGMFTWRGHELLIARSGWSKQGGFEIYMHDSKLGTQLWDDIWNAGGEFNLQPGCPNLIERIESGLLSYGNDMTREDTPLNCGLDRYISLDTHDFIGKSALQAQQEAGISRKLMGVRISGDKIAPLGKPVDCLSGDTVIGMLTSAVYSPDFDCNLGFAMVSSDYFAEGTNIQVALPDGVRHATICNLPFTQ